MGRCLVTARGCPRPPDLCPRTLRSWLTWKMRMEVVIIIITPVIILILILSVPNIFHTIHQVSMKYAIKVLTGNNRVEL